MCRGRRSLPLLPRLWRGGLFVRWCCGWDLAWSPHAVPDALCGSVTVGLASAVGGTLWSSTPWQVTSRTTRQPR
eukprot:12539963-Alexandrium_andersonii.AAC.1